MFFFLFFIFLHPSLMFPSSNNHWLCASLWVFTPSHKARSWTSHTVWQCFCATACILDYNAKVWLLEHWCPISSSKVFWCYQQKSQEECVSALGKCTGTHHAGSPSITCYRLMRVSQMILEVLEYFSYCVHIESCMIFSHDFNKHLSTVIYYILQKWKVLIALMLIA